MWLCLEKHELYLCTKSDNTKLLNTVLFSGLTALMLVTVFKVRHVLRVQRGHRGVTGAPVLPSVEVSTLSLFDEASPVQPSFSVGLQCECLCLWSSGWTWWWRRGCRCWWQVPPLRVWSCQCLLSVWLTPPRRTRSTAPRSLSFWPRSSIWAKTGESAVHTRCSYLFTEAVSLTAWQWSHVKAVNVNDSLTE